MYILLGAALFPALAAEILFAEPHHHMIWNLLPGADIAIGFAGAWLLILLAKKLMAGLLQRREDHYETHGTCRCEKEADGELSDGGDFRLEAAAGMSGAELAAASAAERESASGCRTDAGMRSGGEKDA